MMEPLACLIKVLDDNLQNYLACLGFLQLVRLASNSTLQGMVLYMTIILVIKSQKYVTGYLLRRSRNPSCISRHTFAGPNLTVID